MMGRLRDIGAKECVAAGNSTDWRYLLPSSVGPPFLYLLGGSEAPVLEGRLVNEYIPLHSGRGVSGVPAGCLMTKHSRFSLVVWELNLRPSTFGSKVGLLEHTLEEVRCLVTRGGYLYLAVQRHPLSRQGVSHLRRLLTTAGFSSCHAYYVLPSHAYPMHFVPVGQPDLVRHYVLCVASARSRTRRSVLALARLLLRLRLEVLFPWGINSISLVARHEVPGP